MQRYDPAKGYTGGGSRRAGVLACGLDSETAPRPPGFQGSMGLVALSLWLLVRNHLGSIAYPA